MLFFSRALHTLLPFPQWTISKWIPVTFCTCFTFNDTVLSIMWTHTGCPYDRAKSLVHSPLKSHSRHLSLIFSLICFLSSLMSSVLPLCPLRINCCGVVWFFFFGFFLLFQTIISERPGQRVPLFMTISPTFKPTHTAHHPLNSTYSCLFENTLNHTQRQP